MARIIGIGGVSRSGKSSLANRIKARSSGLKVLILSQDDFVKPESDIPKIQDRTDWEHPNSIDVRELIKAIKYNKDAYSVIIVEGLLAFHFNELKDLYDLKIITEISKETFLERRKKETRWGSEPKWYWEHVWDSFLKYGQLDENPIIRVSGETHLSNSLLDDIIEYIDS